MYSFGIILNRIKDYYQVRQDTANLVASLNLGLSYLAGKRFANCVDCALRIIKFMEYFAK